MILLAPLLRDLVLVYHVGLGMSSLSWNSRQRLNEVVLIGELEHTSLGKMHQGHRRAGTWLPFHRLQRPAYSAGPHLPSLNPPQPHRVAPSCWSIANSFLAILHSQRLQSKALALTRSLLKHLQGFCSTTIRREKEICIRI